MNRFFRLRIGCGTSRHFLRGSNRGGRCSCLLSGCLDEADSVEKLVLNLCLAGGFVLASGFFIAHQLFFGAAPVTQPTSRGYQSRLLAFWHQPLGHPLQVLRSCGQYELILRPSQTA